MNASSLSHRGYAIHASYLSKSGTGRICQSVQGYTFMGDDWAPSIRGARKRIDYMLAAHADRKLSPQGLKCIATKD